MRIVEPDELRNYATIVCESSQERVTDLDPMVVKVAFRSHGAILFKGFNMDLDNFRTMGQNFSASFVQNDSDGREIVDAIVQTVNLGTEPFPLHAELARLPWRPDIAWFACARAPKKGGETTICDGVKLVENLPADLRSYLSQRSLLYRWEISCEQYDAGLARCAAGEPVPFEFSIEGEHYYRYFKTPFFNQPLFCDKLAFASFLLFSRYQFRTKEFPLFEDGTQISDEICDQIKHTGNAITVAIEWETNDLVMLDNTRFMHGRTRIDEPDERLIFSQFSYASFLPPQRLDLMSQPWRQRVGVGSG